MTVYIVGHGNSNNLVVLHTDRADNPHFAQSLRRAFAETQTHMFFDPNLVIKFKFIQSA